MSVLGDPLHPIMPEPANTRVIEYSFFQSTADRYVDIGRAYVTMTLYCDGRLRQLRFNGVEDFRHAGKGWGDRGPYIYDISGRG